MSLNLKTLSPLKRAWYKWKAIKFPWRNKLLVGLDLAGNTYHIFRPTRSTVRWRRIVQYPTGRNTHFSDVSVPPSWHQWLRYTREDPPTIEEQEAEVARQERIKVLAKLADERWEAKAKYIPDTPGAGEQQPTRTIGKSGEDEFGQPVSPLVGEGMKKSSPYTEGTSGGVVSGVETSGVSNQAVFGSEEQKQEAKEEGEKIRAAAAETATGTTTESVTAADPRTSSATAHATPADQTAGTREGTWDKMMKEQKQFKKKKGIDPWKQAQASNPSGEWQPKAWDPTGNLGNKKR